jgi:simple sugar transport system permease protein
VNRLQKFGSKIRVPALSISVALLVGAIFIIFTDIEVLGGLLSDPIGALSLGIGRAATAYSALFRGAFGDPENIGKALASNGDPLLLARAMRPLVESVVSAVPLIFVGLGVSVAFRTGIFNIGGGGQYAMGAVGGTIAALTFGGGVLPAPIALFLVMIFGIVGGALWGFIPGFLKARAGASEVITTIMLNAIAIFIVFFLVANVEFIQEPLGIQPVSKELSQFVDIPGILPIASLRLDIGIIVALLTAVAVSWFLFRSTRGFELRAAGLNIAAARYAGMRATTSIITAMVISGAISGLGGAIVAVGTVNQLSPGIAGSVGFTAIAIALVGGTRPSGVVATALVFGLLQNGGRLMQVETRIPIEMLLFIQALVIAFIAAPELTLGILKNPFRRRPRSVTK